MMKLRSILDEGGISLLQDIIRGHFKDVAVGEDAFYRLMGMDVEEPTFDIVLVRDIAAWIADGIVLPGLFTALWEFLIQHHPALRPGAPSVPQGIIPDFNVLEAGTDTHDFFMWLSVQSRTHKEACRRWPKETVERLWRYFKADRLRGHGYAAITELRGDEETLRIIQWQETSISSD